MRTLQATNKALNKRRKAKKARIHQGNALIIEDTQDIIAQKDVNKQVQRDVYAAGSNQGERQSSGQ